MAVWGLAACGRIGFAREEPDATTDLDAAPDPSLVAWFAMETDPADAIQDLAGGAPATCMATGCPVLVPGIRGSAIELDGIDDRLLVPDSPRLRLTTAFTVSVWLQWFGGDAAVITKPQNVGTGASFELSVLPDTILGCTDDTLGAAGESCMAPAKPPLMATWFALALTWDGGTRTLYVDGVPVASSSHGVAYDDHPLIIGGDDHDSIPSSHHHGLIDELQIYDRVLSSQEIAELHQP